MEHASGPRRCVSVCVWGEQFKSAYNSTIAVNLIKTKRTFLTMD